MSTSQPDPLARFGALTSEWFSGTFAAPTDAQAQAWSAIADGDNTLVIAPTGSGKTLAAFLWAIDRLADTEPRPAGAGTRVLYVSPLKALAVDVERNLRTPLTGITRITERRGLPAPDISVGVRSGDTPPARRRELITKPPDILITTPESLFLMLTLGRSRHTGRGPDRHRRRGTRCRGDQTRRTLGAVAGTARSAVGHARAADRAVGDRPAAGGGGAVSLRAGQDDDRRAAGDQDVRPVGAGTRSRHGQPGEQHDLAGRRGAHRRPDRGAPQLDRVRQLAAARRTTYLSAQRDSRRTERDRTAVRAQPPSGRRLSRAHHGQRAGFGRRTAAGPRPPRLGQQGTARRRRGRPQDWAAEGRRRHLQPGARHRHGVGRSGDPGRVAAVGGQRAATHRQGRTPGRRDLAGRPVSEAPYRPDRLRGDGAADAVRRDRNHAGADEPARRAGPAHRGRVRARAAGRRPLVRRGAAQRTVRDTAAQRVRGDAGPAQREVPVHRVRRIAPPAGVRPRRRHPHRTPRCTTAGGHLRWRDPRPRPVHRLSGFQCGLRKAFAGRRTRRGDGIRVAARRRHIAGCNQLANHRDHPRPGAGHPRTGTTGAAAVLAWRRCRQAG